MKYTISDIARLAGVSKATVSRVINNKDRGVGPETKARILRLIDELGYLPNTLARSIVVSQTKTIGLVVPDIVNPFFPQLIQGIVRHASQQGYTVFLCNSDNDIATENKLVMSLIEKRVDGVILATSAEGDDSTCFLLKHYGIPVVQVDRVAARANAGASVSIDNRGGTYAATRYLLQAGHRRIALLGGPKGLSTTTQRWRGYRDAHADQGVDLPSALLFYGEYSIEGGLSMTGELLRTEEEFTAVLAGCDTIAIGCVKALLNAGVRVPEQCEVIGFDGIEMAEIFDPPVSTVAQPIGEIAEEATNLLVGIMSGSISSDRHIVIEPSLILRRTTRMR